MVEKAGSCGNFFKSFPRRRDFISFNKPSVPNKFEGWTADAEEDYSYKFDWHSMLTTDTDGYRYNNRTRFTEYTDKFYPKADTFVEYIEDVVTNNKLNVQYNTNVLEVSPQVISKWSKTNAYREVTVEVLDEKQNKKLQARVVVLATGLVLREDKKGDELWLKRFPNAQHYTYATCPVDDCKAYRGKYVVVVGNGKPVLK